MENSILNQFYVIFNDLDLFNQVVNDHNYNNIDYRSIKSIVDNKKSLKFEVNEIFLTYSETIEYMKNNKIELSFVEGLEFLEIFRDRQVSQIEDILEYDFLIKQIIEDQVRDSVKDRHFNMLMPNFFDKLGIVKDKEDLKNHLFELAIKHFKNSCTTFNYLQSFLNNGLHFDEYQLIDSNFQFV